MKQGRIIAWLKKEGEQVKKGEPLLTIDTDKVTINVESPYEGTIRKILSEKGEKVPINQVIALIGDPDEELPDLSQFLVTSDIPSMKDLPFGPVDTLVPTFTRRAGKVLASPRAKLLAQEKGIQLASVRGSGPRGEVLERDVIAWASRPITDLSPVLLHPSLQIRRSQTLEGIRKIIADRMRWSLQSSAQLTITMQVDMSQCMSVRKLLNQVKGRKKVSYMALLGLIVSQVLQESEYEVFNASVENNEILHFIENINLGIAAATERGLLVPVVKNANKKSLDELNDEITLLAQDAREGTISLEDLEGSTFTITNLGMFDVDSFTPILNPPEVAILGVGRIVEQVIAHKGTISVVPTTTLSLSFDHQIIDGHQAALFLQRIKWLLEDQKSLTRLIKDRNYQIKKESLTKEAQQMPDEFDTQFLIIGAGPGGEACAVRLAELGAKVTVVERDLLGGVCVNNGCIPVHFALENLGIQQQIHNLNERQKMFSHVPEVSFAGLKSAIEKLRDTLQEGIRKKFENSGIELIQGTAQILDPNRVEITLESDKKIEKVAKTIIIATGATFKPMQVEGHEDIKDNILQAEELMELNFETVPSSLVIFGLNSPCIELATLFHSLGSEVTILCPEDSLISFGSPQLGEIVEELLDFRGIDIFKQVKLKRFIKAEGQHFSIEFQDEGTQDQQIEATIFVNAFQRQGNLECIKDLPLEIENSIPVLNHVLQSSIESIYFLGDVRGNESIPFLSYRASFEGQSLAEILMGKDQPVDISLIPRGVGLDLPIAVIGLTAQQALKQGLKVKAIQYPLAYNAFAHILGKIEGYIMLIVETTTGKIHGGEIVGPDAFNLIALIGTAIVNEATIEDLKKFPGFHPSLSEGVLNCAWKEE